MASQSRLVYNDDYYVPPSDTEEEGNPSYFTLLNVDPNSVSVNPSTSDNRNNPTDNGIDTDTGLYNLPSPSNSPTRTQSSSSGNTSPLSTPPTPALHPRMPRSLFEVYDTDSSNESDNDVVSETESLINEEPRNTKLMDNYEQDVEHIDDFANGWEWLNRDKDGASYGPFTGSNLLLIPPDGEEPIDYLNLFIPDSMYHLITTETNRYAQRKKQGK